MSKFVALHESGVGTNATCRHVLVMSAFGSIADEVGSRELSHLHPQQTFVL
jgi:hypothetical protein